MQIDPNKIYKSSEVAKYFGVTPDTLKRWGRKGDIAFITINTHRYYKGAEILRFEASRTGGVGNGN